MVREGSARMKAGILLTAILVLSSTGHADTAREVGKGIANIAGSEAVKSATGAYKEGVQSSIWHSMCKETDLARRSAHCFVTPSGLHIWEMPDGPDKVYWLKVANKERSVHIRRKIETQKQWREEADRRIKADSRNAQHCQFWMDQTPSERKDEKVRQYC